MLLSSIWKMTMAEGLALTASSRLDEVEAMLSAVSRQDGLARQVTDSPCWVRAAASLEAWLLPTMMKSVPMDSVAELSMLGSTSLLVDKLESRFTSNFMFNSAMSWQMRVLSPASLMGSRRMSGIQAVWKTVGLRLSSEVGSLSLRMGDPCAVGVQFSSVEEVLLRSLGRGEAEGNSPRKIASGEAVLGTRDGRAEGLLLEAVSGAEG